MLTVIRTYLTEKQPVLAAAAVTWIVQNAANVGLHIDGAALGALTLVVGSVVALFARSVVTCKDTLDKQQPSEVEAA